MGADHPLPLSWLSATVGRCRVQQSPVEGLSRLQETNSQLKGVPIGNGPRKKWMFENISTNWQWHKFLFIGGSCMPWWNWKMIQRNSWKVSQRLVENRQTRVFATFEQGQPTKFVEQTSDRSYMAKIFFNKTGSMTLNYHKFELLNFAR